MQNLGLALAFVFAVAAPHAAHAKKKHPVKHAKHGKRAKPAKKARAQRPVREVPPPKIEPDDSLASAVAEQQARPDPVMTSAIPAMANEPLSMDNQVLDDEVPGSRQKKR